MSEQTEIYKMAMIENMVTVVATALCVGLVAIGTDGSLHCFWGLLMLCNLNSFKGEKDRDEPSAEGKGE